MTSDDAWMRVDFSGARTRRVGAERGVSPAVERSWKLRVIRAREEVRTAHERGLVPHGTLWAEVPPVAETPELPLRVLGEPGAVRAVLLGLEGQPEIVGTAWETDFVGNTVRVDGGPHLSGQADPNDDLRFGPFGSTARSIRYAALGTERAAAVDDAILVAAAWCSQVSGDPAVDLAAALAPAAFDAASVVLVAEPGLESLASWWSRALAAITCKASSDGTNRVPRGLAAQPAELADEALLQLSLNADPAPWVVLLTHDSASPGVVRAREATRSVLVRAGTPVVEVRLRDSEPPAVLATAWVGLEAALTIAVAVGVEPLTLIPGEDLRSRMDSAGDPPT